VLPLLSAYRAEQDLLSAVFYVANWRFIVQGTDYLAASTDHSVVLHFWSLAVEEQFYLIWPGVILLAMWAARRFATNETATVAGCIGVLTVGSLAASILLTSTNPGLAYMATFTRAWQFGVGGALAVATGALNRAARTRAARRGGWWLGWAGLGAIVWACLSLTSETPTLVWRRCCPRQGPSP